MTYSPEELRDDPHARHEYVLQSLRELSTLQAKIQDHSRQLVFGHQKERREILKYLGTIAGGAAALAPQLLPQVQQFHIFYLGIGLLCMVVVITATYILSTIENESDGLMKNMEKNRSIIAKLRQPKEEFIEKSDGSYTAFVDALTAFNSDDIKDMVGVSTSPNSEHRLFIRADYIGEFTVLFITVGLAMIAFSLSSRIIVNWLEIGITCLVVFILINLVSSYPREIFKFAGLPIDTVKFLFRWWRSKIIKK